MSPKCDECQRTFMALARSYERASSVVFVRALFLFADEHASTQCGEVIGRLSKAYRDNIGEATAKRVASFEDTCEDTRRTVQATLHLRDDTIRALTKHMTWSSYFRYRD